MIRVRLPRNTIRLRLTLAYSGLFLVSGAALLLLIYVLARQQYTQRFFISSGNTGIQKVLVQREGENGVVVSQFGVAPKLSVRTQDVVGAAAGEQSGATRHTLLVDSGIALAVMAMLSLGLGWAVAGRALAPLRTITSTTREISARNLHRRLALAGPDDELKQLGTTIDDLLERLERAFEAQRRFVANASHELRTPLTFERTLLEVTLADPDTDAAKLRTVCETLLDNGLQQERMIEALLTLSRSQRGLEDTEPLDLAAIASASARAFAGGEPELRTRLDPAPGRGDVRLLERLVGNLLANAVRYNATGGWVEVTTGTPAGRPTLTVANTGPVLTEADVARMFEPFQRLDPAGDGLGLGLSIVDAIAAAHDAHVAARPRAGGGLVVDVALPPVEPLA